jgi:hypothetical protein
MRSATLFRIVALTIALLGFIDPWFSSASLTRPSGTLGQTPRDTGSQPAEERVTYPQLESRVDPVYPPEASDAGLEADVILQVTIRKDGTVDDESTSCLRCIVRRKGKKPEEVLRGWCDDFCGSSIEATALWRYTPATRDGEPVEVYFTIGVTFVLP